MCRGNHEIVVALRDPSCRSIVRRTAPIARRMSIAGEAPERASQSMGSETAPMPLVAVPLAGEQLQPVVQSMAAKQLRTRRRRSLGRQNSELVVAGHGQGSPPRRVVAAPGHRTLRDSAVQRHKAGNQLQTLVIGADLAPHPFLPPPPSSRYLDANGWGLPSNQKADGVETSRALPIATSHSRHSRHKATNTVIADLIRGRVIQSLVIDVGRSASPASSGCLPVGGGAAAD